MPLGEQKTNDTLPERYSDASDPPGISLKFPFGLNENLDQDVGECSDGYNFELAYGQTGMVPRAPFDLKGTAPNAGAITGIMQLVKRDNTQTTLIAAGNVLYKWDGASSWTNKASITAPALLRDTYWSLGDYSIVTDINQNNVVGKWDGSTYAALTTTGLASALYAKYAIVFLNRVWLFNIKYGSSSYPHMILACKFEDPTNWDISTRGGPTNVGGGSFATGLEAFYLLVPDLKPINGVCLFANQLIISTDTGRLWNLQGTSSSTFQFVDFYDNSPAVGQENVVTIGNDVVFARQGGAIALVSATQSYGNVFTGNLSSWLPDTTANLNGFSQIVYDVANQKVFFFTTGKVLVLYKNLLAQDRYQVLSGKSPWSIYTTLDSSQFTTQAAKFMFIPGTTNYSVYWGDSTGRVMDMNGTGVNGDAGSSIIQSFRMSRHYGNDTVQPWPWTRENITGHIRYKRINQVDFTVGLIWDEEFSSTQNTVTLKGQTGADTAPYFGGTFYYTKTSYYSQGFQFKNYISGINIDPGGKGPGFYISTFASCNSTYEVTSIDLE
jgi:hypothetical protein